MSDRKRTDGRVKLGRQGEDAAAEHLLAQGYRIVERNWRCPTGELDLIAEHGGVTVFVEVRSRRDTGTFGSPEESIDARKRKKVRETAHYYLYRNRSANGPSRFDVITVTFTPSGAFLKLNHLINAF
ncbi:YraN family protein [Paenibacillus sp. GYB003]|uniref:YraN family protein n=1 Tax=Paenibacillus sp. GYB003 TaxID=2994392 RepID=UPI002F967A27